MIDFAFQVNKMIILVSVAVDQLGFGVPLSIVVGLYAISLYFAILPDSQHFLARF